MVGGFEELAAEDDEGSVSGVEWPTCDPERPIEVEESESGVIRAEDLFDTFLDGI